MGSDSKLRTRVSLLLILDAFLIFLSSFLALWIRYEFDYNMIAPEFLGSIYAYAPINIAISISVFYAFRLYSSLWKHASVTELECAVKATVTSGIVNSIVMYVLKFDVPKSYPFLYTLFLFVFVTTVRFSYRYVRYLANKRRTIKNKGNIMIVGAGASGSAIIKEMRTSQYMTNIVCCAIDDDPLKKGKYIQGVQVVGNRHDIISSVEKYNIDEIFITMPSASRKEVKNIIEICYQTNCKIKVLPGMYQLINEELTVSQLRDVSIEDLLGRDPIQVNLDEILGYVQNKVVMVTGGGGSIGSELCRQLAAHGVKQLVLFDVYENNAYDIQMELQRKYGKDLDLVVLIGSVRNTHRIETVIEKYRPEVIYHAAAHKHVPLMEDSPNEAIKNNVFGTYKTAKAAAKYGVKRFVLISTDKAVNPTNIMGASKRLCEMVVQMMNRQSPNTEFVAVRFGNVLGSNGSVIPLFKKQIAEGGPVTVTHKDIIRYFMTIPEAVSLVLQAGAYAKGGEIFILDMGEPVKIDDLARNLIRLSGYKVDEDIEIKYTGLRPGEKLYEELLMDEEGMQDTDNKLIHIGKPIEMDDELFLRQLDRLNEVSKLDTGEIKYVVKEVVPTYVIKENKKA